MNEKLTESFDTHRRNGHISLAKHVQDAQQTLSTSISARRKIYLDLRFWIGLRRAHISPQSCDPLQEQLLNCLREGVQSEKLICPISDATFVELLKQTDQTTLTATAELVDALSKGIALVTFAERVEEEIWFALATVAKSADLTPPAQRIWTKLPYVLGDMHPHATTFSPVEELVIQKILFEELWDTKLLDVLKRIGGNRPPPCDWERVARNMNEQHALHAEEVTSYANVYRIAFEGGLNLFRRTLMEAAQAISLNRTLRVDIVDETLSAAQRFKKLTRLIPTLDVYAACIATIRRDKRRRLSGNDLLDFHHAQAALAYCDVFLTEGPLKTLLQQRHHGLAETYDCIVISDVREALTTVGM